MIGSWCVLLACIANFGPFVDVTTEIGVVGPEPANSSLFIDYDEDGDLDLFIASGSYASSKLYENLGAGYFMDVTWRSGLDVEPGIISVHQGALGTESWADLLVVEALPDEPPAVYKIGEDRVFTRVRPGLEAGRTTTGLLLGDFDSDGFLDLYQMNSALFGEGTDIVYRNLGDGSMENVTAGTGLADVADTRGACSGDFDNDEDLDLYVFSASGPNRLYANLGDGTFRDVTEETGLASVANGRAAQFADLDGDLDLDLIVGGDDTIGTALFQNRSGIFLDATTGSGLSGLEEIKDIEIVDMDLDGDLDLALCGSDRPLILLRNEGDLRFEDITESLGLPFIPDAVDLTCADFDSDGDPDLCVSSRHGPVLLQNAGFPGRFVKIRLEGTVSNPSAIGARVTLIAGNTRCLQVVPGGSGGRGGNTLELLFGLGDSPALDSILVLWPSGIRQHLSCTTGNVVLTIQEPGPAGSMGEVCVPMDTLITLLPNPSKGPVTFEYRVKEPSEIELQVLSPLGQLISTLEWGYREPGHYMVTWVPETVNPGTYLIRYKMGGTTYFTKFVLLK
jgi:hypothetical protein